MARRGWALFFLPLLAAPVAMATDPFSVSPALEKRPSGEVALSIAFTMGQGHYLYADQISVTTTQSVELVPETPPTPKQKHDPFSDKAVGVYDHDFTLSYRVKGDVPDPLEVRIGYQGCNASLCFLPQTRAFSLSAGSTGVVHTAPPPRMPVETGAGTATGWQSRVVGFAVTGRAAGYLAPREFLDFLDRAETGRGLGEDRLADTFRRKGIWFSLLLILLGGLALNLTPCVLPMIPINLAIIGAGAQAGSRRRGFALGAVYGAGIALVYGVLGLAAILTGARFGMLNASPGFNFGIAALFIILSLAMFGVFNLDFSRFQRGIGAGSSRSGAFATAFVIGGVAALLAGACVAPVLISVLLLSADLYSRGIRMGLLLPFCLGLGMALPWPFAGAGLSFLPKPGRWMEIVKYGFGVLIIVFAAWYGHLGYSLLKGRTEADRAAVVAAQEAQAKEGGWLMSMESALDAAERQRKPVFIDFWASWCKNCLHMEKTTFRNADVSARLGAYVRLKFRAEDLGDPGTRAVLDHFGVVGLPTYVTLEPEKK